MLQRLLSDARDLWTLIIRGQMISCPGHDFYRAMDMLAAEISWTATRIALCARKGSENERLYYGGVWEALVLKHMEFEDILRGEFS